MEKPGTSALIVGSNGQDGRVLQEIFHRQNRKFYCSTRFGITNPCNQEVGNIELNGYSDLIRKLKIDEVYFLAAEHSPAQIHSAESSQTQMQNQLNLISNVLIQLLELIRSFSPHTKLFFASSALVFGSPISAPQDENTPREPTEIYGLFKSLSQEIVTFYREAYGLYAFSGVLYPHESEYRKENFLFMKILKAAAMARSNPDLKLDIADMTFKREWNCAYQTMNSVINLMNLDSPGDFVIGSGVQHTVEEIVRYAFEYFEIDFRDYVENSTAILIPRSSLLLANPEKLIMSIGSAPDGDIKSLLSRTFPRL